MNYFILSKKNDNKFFEFIKKTFYKSNKIKNNFLDKYKKCYYFFSFFKIKNLIKIFWKNDIYFAYRILIIGLKLNPIWFNKNVSIEINKFSQNNLKNTCIQMFVIKNFSKKNDFINVSTFIRFYMSNTKKKKQKLRFPRFTISKSNDFFFEETADEIKFTFNTNFIQLSLSYNQALGSCWLILKYSFVKILNFWKTYINSCYNQMTRCKKNFEINQYKKSSNSYKILYDQKILEFEFFYLKKPKNTNFSIQLFKLLETRKNFLYKFSYEKYLYNLEHNEIRWRNRCPQKLCFLSKICKKITSKNMKKQLIILIC